jgi:hypothetical protein
VRQDYVGWQQLWSYKTGGWLAYTFNVDNDNAVKAQNALIDVAVREEARWTAAAQASYARNRHNATIYVVGLANDEADIDEEILRQLANQRTDDTGFDTSQKVGRYYFVDADSTTITPADKLKESFEDIARRAGAVLVK